MAPKFGIDDSAFRDKVFKYIEHVIHGQSLHENAGNEEANKIASEHISAKRLLLSENPNLNFLPHIDQLVLLLSKEIKRLKSGKVSSSEFRNTHLDFITRDFNETDFMHSVALLKKIKFFEQGTSTSKLTPECFFDKIDKETKLPAEEAQGSRPKINGLKGLLKREYDSPSVSTTVIKMPPELAAKRKNALQRFAGMLGFGN